MLIDGQAAYREIAAASHHAKQFIYLTISYGAKDFLLVPESKEILFDILRSRQQDGVDVRMVVWQPLFHTLDTIPAPVKIEGVNGRIPHPKPLPRNQAWRPGIRELYLNALMAAREGSLVYIENQYFFDHGIISEIHEAAVRGAKIIALLTSKPDEGLPQGRVESILEKTAHYQEESRIVRGHRNVALLTLGNSRPDPRSPGKIIYSETYIHSKTMAVLAPNWTVMTGGSANIAFTSMWFHSEMNIAFMDPGRIKDCVAQLWSEHLQISVEKAQELIEKPADAFNFFIEQAARNLAALETGQMPEGRVYDWRTEFPKRELAGINLGDVQAG